MSEFTPRDMRFATDVRRLEAGVAGYTALAAMVLRRAPGAWRQEQARRRALKAAMMARRGN